MDKLKPCPFCGGEARTMEQHRWWVSCQECMCDLGFEGMDENGCYGHYDTEAEAIEAWNTRKWKTCRLELEEPNEDGVWWCSYCKSYHQHKSKYPWGYCPRCGAKVVSE